MKTKPFESMTPAEKRVVIAKDVIKQIKAKHFIADTGIFFKVSLFESDEVNRETIKSNTCGVCAKGAVFASWIGKFNNYNKSIFDIPDENINGGYKDFPDGLKDAFPRGIYDNIEAAFEGYSFGWHYNTEKTGKFTNLFYHIKDSNKRLIAIMNHLIKNNGKFPAIVKKS